LVGLDGIRGIAALFVVLHHCWLVSFDSFPVNAGPVWTDPLLYGHLAVGVFIVLSGFSLAVAPAWRDWEVGDLRRFAQRRAWRILPPYWAALAFSLAVAWMIESQPDTASPTAKSVVVFGLLLQDVIGSPSPNGAFWSIAIEAQLYFVFPLLVWVLRRAGAAVMLALVGSTVAAIGLLAPRAEVIDRLMRFTPQFAALFAIGIVAAGVVNAAPRIRRLPWPWLAGAAALPVLILMAVRGSAWAVDNYFWVDLALGPAIGLLLVAIAVGRPRPLVRELDSGPIRALGSFSYSLYLTHSPIVVVVHAKLVAPRTGTAGFLMTLAVAVPICLAVARAFAALFELPFTRHRTWPELRRAALASVGR
jgi:peptidoglycan/LPS O-acetylase OafA/YrhL